MRKRLTDNNPNDRASSRPVTRCGIYTRKSSEEGLEQAFNSLDAQREACEAYILSQKHAGWVALPTMYDDGGISGGTLERPALQRLLADITARRVDTVVVYKVDRLTRSLADFAKIVDVFDASGVAFVSVTQQFNTTSSMGRLTLNMLLSFAQFEREVTGERIRDKIAASKQKGMWMGGYPPLGYDVSDRKLVVNAEEADTVRHIFDRYTALKSVRALAEELRADGIVSKVRSGLRSGARPLVRGALYYMLQNQLYRGQTVYKGSAYPGQHDAIVDPELWERVQAALAESRVERRGRGEATAQPSLLTGLVWDGAGDRMSPSHANKNGTRYRYYVSQSLLKQVRANAPAASCRVPAGDLERLVETSVRDLLADPAAIDDLGRAVGADTDGRRALLKKAADLGVAWPDLTPAERIRLLKLLVARITVLADAVQIEMPLGYLINCAAADRAGAHPDSPTIVRTIPARLTRTGMQTTLLIDGEPGREPNRSLVRLLARAHQFHAAIMNAQGKSIQELAQDAGVGSSYFARVLRLAFLSPAVTHAILHGRQPVELTANKLQHASRLPNAWIDQHRELGLG